MIREKIDNMIAEAAVARDPAVETLRLIKAEYQKYNASKEAVKTPMDDTIEVQILNKMVKQRTEAAELYMHGGRSDLAQKEISERQFIEKFLPKPAGREEIAVAISEVLYENGLAPEKKNMGAIIKGVKAKHPTADGKLVAQMVAAKIN